MTGAEAPVISGGGVETMSYYCVATESAIAREGEWGEVLNGMFQLIAGAPVGVPTWSAG